VDVRALGTLVAEELGSRSVSDATFVLGDVDDERTHVLRIGEREGILEDGYTAVGSGNGFPNGVIDAAKTRSLVLEETSPRRSCGRKRSRA
jgi:hypothetical protein